MGNPVRNFDSLSYANELRDAGVPEKQAQLQAKALFRVVDEQLLNKQDLERVEVKLGADIKDVKTDVEKVEAKLAADIKEVKAEVKEVKRDVAEAELRLKSEIKDAELRLLVRLIGAMTLIGGVLKFLPAVHF